VTPPEAEIAAEPAAATAAELAPRDEAELAEAVAEAAAAGRRLEIVGGGTRRALGRPVQADVRLSTRGLSGIALYEPAALTLVAGAGAPLAEIEAMLAAEGQRLPFEPIDHRALLGSQGEPTLGGVAAVNASGPRRIQVGACRDALLGVRFVDGRGRRLKSGGRVMKNVTGYDLVKLSCGAYGTLGALTELAFKLQPIPEATRVLLFDGLDDARAVEALSAALGSPFDVSGAAHAPAGVDGEPVTMIRVEGFEASVEHRAKALRERLSGFGAPRVEGDPERTAAGWRWIRDVEAFAGREGAVWRVSVKPSDGPPLVAALGDRVRGALYDWGGGLVWLLTEENGDAGAAATRAEAARRGGHATLIRARPETRRAVSPFHPEPPVLARLSTELRRRFDPQGVLNPGRMAADRDR
jgi:glycolate oxidase FAD binding subunit